MLPDTPSRQPVALAMTGRFPSAFAGEPHPLVDGAEGEGRVLEASVADGRLLVVGSAELASDLLLQIASQTGGEVHRGNLQLVQNAIDWAVEDTSLLAIRSAGAFARVLEPVGRDQATWIEARTWALTAGGLAAVLLFAAAARRRRPLLPLDPPVEAA